MSKVINISSNGIKQAIDDLVNENEMLQDKVYKLENIIKEVREYIEKYEVINGYYDSNYDGENDTYSHDLVKEDILEILDKEKEND